MVAIGWWEDNGGRDGVGDDHDDGGLDDTVRSDFSPMLADLVILADLLRRTDPVRFQVRQPGRP